jgi:pseudaminic acid synthase
MSTEIIVQGRRIGPTHPPLMIAEISANHGGSLERALNIIEAAKRSGADAIKLQTYTADSMTIAHDSEDFKIRGGLWDGFDMYSLYQEAHTPWEWHPALFERARSLGLIAFSTPFDAAAVDFLERLDNPIYKIASFELTDIELVRKAASTGKPLIMSTGLATQAEIQEAVDAARLAGSGGIMLLHCVSSYPAPTHDANLSTLAEMSRRFGDYVIGLSDHTLSPAVAVAAVALGASIIEKHFTLRRKDGGADSAFSLEPDEFAALAMACRDAHAAIGVPTFGCVESERGNLRFRRSIYVTQDVAAGEVLSPNNVRVIRPSFGLEPKFYPQVLGRRVLRDLKRGTPLDWSMLVADRNS